MSLNVTYDQCYYGIVKMRDETEARIPLLHIPSFYPSCKCGAGNMEEWRKQTRAA